MTDRAGRSTWRATRDVEDYGHDQLGELRFPRPFLDVNRISRREGRMFFLGVVVGLLIALLLGFYLAGQTQAAESSSCVGRRG